MAKGKIINVSLAIDILQNLNGLKSMILNSTKRTKMLAGFKCVECGATEQLQAHHVIPGDNSTLICLCAECHANKHPEVPRNLILSKNSQPYWENISAASLAKTIGYSSRTVIRHSRRLGIKKGILSDEDRAILIQSVTRGYRNGSTVYKGIICPNCNDEGERIISVGFNITKRGKFRRLKCKECGTTFYANSEYQSR